MSAEQKRLGRLPGDPGREEALARALRVDQAGEFGAKRIYEGQLAVLGATADAPALNEMLATELEHLETFNKLLVERRVRPTALSPLWHLAGFALGAGTAILGREAAMACTVAVEEVIEEHYTGQLAALEAEGEEDLKRTLAEFRADEVAHRDKALEAGALEAPGFAFLTGAVKAGSRLAIWLSERI